MKTDATHVVCPACDAVNRVPSTRLAQHPICGHCRAALFSGSPIALSATSFRTHLARSDLPIVVDFWASWCGPCKSMAPEFANAATTLEPHVRLAKINIESEASVATNHRIGSIPTMLMFINGAEAGRRTGALRAAEIVDWTRAQLAAAA